jgi:predicted nucleic acid-binding protein
VTLILDAAPLVALANSKEPQREALLETLRAEPGSLIVPAPVTAEVDYLLGERFGSTARRAFLSDLAARRYEAEGLTTEDYRVAQEIELRYADLALGLADCSIVILAARHETRRLFSFDERHFRTVAPLQGGTFELLPADA